MTTTPYITMPSSQITPRTARTLIERVLRELDLRTSPYSRRVQTGELLRDEYTTTEVWLVNAEDAVRLQRHLTELRPQAEVTVDKDPRPVVSCQHHVTIKW